ncbi:hypothetical protein Lepto7375DRAFT_4314 [Leptolyngbya sp. PCC 7375]|nr:hypothetical protein Lepto7375DRAFT_4314 [Leptolyngbya sp. PCC 7375]
MSSQPSVQTGQPSQQPSQPRSKGKAIARLILLALLATGTWVTLFTTGVVTLGGVPYSVLIKVWQTPATRAALLRRDSYALHDLMDNMGIEAEIKRYYSKRIKDPVELDQHIHQILYDRTRYVGENYVVVRGKLIPKSYDMVEELYECPEC